MEEDEASGICRAIGTEGTEAMGEAEAERADKADGGVALEATENELELCREDEGALRWSWNC